MGSPLSERQIQMLRTLNTALQELMAFGEDEIMDLIRKLRTSEPHTQEDVKSSFSTLNVLLQLVWYRRYCKKAIPKVPRSKT